MDTLDLKKVHKTGVFIVLIFGVIAVILLVYFGGRYAYPVILFWMLIPVFIKKILDKLRSRNKEGYN